MTKEEKIIATAFTGKMFIDGSDMGLLYEYMEKKVGHGVINLMLANKGFWEELHKACEQDFIDMVSKEQPSLPSNLNDAAIQAHIRLENGEGLSFLSAFKAGAEWMAEQGISIPAHIFMPCEIKDVYDSSKGEYPAAIHPDCGGSLVLERYLKDFKHNEEVILQIRKKEE